ALGRAFVIQAMDIFRKPIPEILIVPLEAERKSDEFGAVAPIAREHEQLRCGTWRRNQRLHHWPERQNEVPFPVQQHRPALRNLCLKLTGDPVSASNTGPALALVAVGQHQLVVEQKGHCPQRLRKASDFPGQELSPLPLRQRAGFDARAVLILQRFAAEGLAFALEEERDQLWNGVSLSVPDERATEFPRQREPLPLRERLASKLAQKL